MKIIIKNQQIFLKELEEFDISLFIKREDQIHPYISGNKYRKLKYNILQAKKENKSTLLTFGGAYSNHISAVAFAGKEYGFKTVGIIRGDELQDNFDEVLRQNSTIKFAHENGMKFEFISRTEYRKKHTKEFIDRLTKEYNDFYLIPEGGTNSLAIKGCEEILKEGDHNFHIICCAVGTGGTISGLINSAKKNQSILGFPALKGNFLTKEINNYAIRNDNWRLISDYNFGGFGKINLDLVNFINQFFLETNISLDPIYTGKMMYGIVDLIKKGFFKKESKILTIHTGGLQGIEGMNSLLKRKKLPLIIT